MSDTTTHSLLREREAAAYLRLKPNTLAQYRCEGIGPSFIRLGGKLGGRIVYAQEEIDRWIRTCTVRPAAAYRTKSGDSPA